MRKNGIWKECIICKKPIYVIPFYKNRKKTCSVNCAKNHQSIVFKGSGNPFYGKKHSAITRERMKKARKRFFTKGGKPSSWRGGKFISSDGYIFIYQSNHPFRNTANYVREHRLVMERMINRYLKPEERVHHINGIKTDNREENLKLFANESEHQMFGKHSKVHK